jgi:hypothetical protein
MVLAHTYILTRVMHRTALPNNDVPGLGKLAAIKFNSQSLAF